MKTKSDQITGLISSLLLAGILTGGSALHAREEGAPPVVERGMRNDGPFRMQERRPIAALPQAMGGNVGHLQQAARHLEAAGFPEGAERIRRMIRQVAADGCPRPEKSVRGAHSGPPPGHPGMNVPREIEALRDELRELRREMRKLHALVGKSAEKPRKKKSKDDTTKADESR